MEWPPHLLTLDFETFWSSDFTLKKLTIEQYVRSPEFKVHGAAVKYGNGPSKWVRGEDLPNFFAQIPWGDVAVLCQNAPFDALILSHIYGHVPALYLCTLAMARQMLPRQRHSLALLSRHFGLPEKGDAVNLTKGLRELPPHIEAALAAYATSGENGTGGDADNTYAVFQKLLGMGFPLGELETVDLTIRMFAQPQLELDKPKARKLLADVIRAKRSALRRLGVTKKDVSSADKFSAILMDRFGIEVEMKAGKMRADGTFRLNPALAKTDAFMKGLLEHENPDVQALAAVRLEVKSTLEETRLYRLLGMHERGKLCVYLNFAGAHTLRWSGGDGMNWQNFTRGSELRKCILAPEGYVLCVADLSQIEARMLNCLAEQWDILQLFESGDPYSVLASKFFDRLVDGKRNPADKPFRQIGKVGELGLGYGMGPPRLRGTLRAGAMGLDPVLIDTVTAEKWVRDYRTSHPNVVKYWEQCETALQLLDARVRDYPWGPMVIHDGKLVLPNGSQLDYTGIRREDGSWHMYDVYGKLKRNIAGYPLRLYGAMMAENVTQALARVVIADAMREMRRARVPLVMTTHDEAGALGRAKDIYQDGTDKEGKPILKHPVLDYMLDTMTKRPKWMPMIPLAAEGGFDVCYSK